MDGPNNATETLPSGQGCAPVTARFGGVIMDTKKYDVEITLLVPVDAETEEEARNLAFAEVATPFEIEKIKVCERGAKK